MARRVLLTLLLLVLSTTTILAVSSMSTASLAVDDAADVLSSSMFADVDGDVDVDGASASFDYEQHATSAFDRLERIEAFERAVKACAAKPGTRALVDAGKQAYSAVLALPGRLPDKVFEAGVRLAECEGNMAAARLRAQLCVERNAANVVCADTLRRFAATACRYAEVSVHAAGVKLALAFASAADADAMKKSAGDDESTVVAAAPASSAAASDAHCVAALAFANAQLAASADNSWSNGFLCTGDYTLRRAAADAHGKPFALTCGEREKVRW